MPPEDFSQVVGGPDVVRLARCLLKSKLGAKPDQDFRETYRGRWEE